ncbi:hypothetical protein ACWEWI_00600 [Streptomyces sp. NPDC003753]|uniref:hypothetical protein n=1 Tax=unclassified Streptomyces TaxID=2593676 RepID=UPI0019070649|nr:hypothetical protein [Streptomyces sp. Y2F8-2]GHK05469.1 hypothetical protein SY2F82_72660 [Streptomyces sp. Y2F8-2]
MKLGKALATGVAEERPQLHEEQADLRVADVADIVEPVEEAPAPEEVPVAR